MGYFSIMIVCFSLFSLAETFGGETDGLLDELKEDLLNLKSQKVQQGWRDTHNEKFAELDKDRSDSFVFNLKESVPYEIVILSECEEGCNGLNLTLYDNEANAVKKYVTKSFL